MWSPNIERKSREYSKLPYLMPRSPMLLPIETISFRDLLNHSLLASFLVFSPLFHLLQLFVTQQTFDITATAAIRIKESIISTSSSAPHMAANLTNCKPGSKEAQSEASINPPKSPASNLKVSLGCMRGVHTRTNDRSRTIAQLVQCRSVLSWQFVL